MKKYMPSMLVFFIIMGWMNSSMAQNGNLNEVMQCTLKPGFTVDEVVRVGRAIPRTDSGPNLVFYREPIVAAAPVSASRRSWPLASQSAFFSRHSSNLTKKTEPAMIDLVTAFYRC